MSRVEFRVLGRLEVHVDCEPLDLGPPKQQKALAALLCHPNEVLSYDRLIEAVWWDPPAAAHANLRGYLSALRRLLTIPDEGESRVRGVRGGYRLAVVQGELDLHRFDELAARGEHALHEGRWAVAARDLTQARDLWRGRALDGLTYGPGLQVKVTQMEELRLAVTERWAQAQLGLGHYERLVTELRGLVAEWPLRERLWAYLMIALHRSGRQAEALAVYARVRAHLAEELGTDPGSELQRLHEQVLRADEDELRPDPLDPPASPSAGRPRPSPRAVPAQLPASVYGFTGRDRELAHLDRILAGEEQSTAVVISAVSGTAGVGKTALAVYWAHQIADRFPDGQLYINLRGFDPSGSVLTPDEALRGFLEALGVPPERVPVELDSRVGLYRSLLAHKRVLLLLDNGRDADQVRPLLPGAPGCLVVVTSRDRLASLVAMESARPLTLDVLTPDDAWKLLANRLGEERVTAEAGAVYEIITRCARLPLALAIVAARAATNAGFPLATLAGQLRQAQGGLDALAGGDSAVDIRAVFSWSYHALSPDAARLFRLLGLQPGPDIAAPAVASLAGIPLAQVRPLLTELTQAHLVTEHTPGRYAFHDLLRAYANEQARHHDADTACRDALRRVVEHYLHTAHAADRLLDPHRPNPIVLAPPQPGVTPESPTDHEQALAWFTTEHLVLPAAITRAAVAGLGTQTWQLAWTMTTFLDRRGRWHDQADVQSAALHAAQRLADPTGQAHTHRSLGRAYARLGRLEEAHTHFRRALDMYQGLDDATGQAHTRLGLAFLCEQQGRHQQALHHTERALHLYQVAGHRAGQANALNNLGWYHAGLGDHERALACCQQALTLLQQIGDRAGEAGTWDSIGYAHHHLGHYRQAMDCYERSLGLYRKLGDRYYEAGTLTHLGDTQHAANDPDAAEDTWKRALDIFDELHHPDAGQVRARLDHLHQP